MWPRPVVLYHNLSYDSSIHSPVLIIYTNYLFKGTVCTSINYCVLSFQLLTAHELLIASGLGIK